MAVLDTQRVQHMIRLAGIDAPEKAQPFGQKSKDSLSRMVFNREVLVVGDKVDRYGLAVAKVFAADHDCNEPTCQKTHDVGLMQIVAGMAWWYRQYAREQSPKDRENYEITEFNAKIHRLGLWSQKNPMPPWEWRRQ